MRIKKYFVSVLIILFLLFPQTVSAQGMMGYWDNDWNNSPGIGWISMLIFWILGALIVYWLIKWFTTNRPSDQSTPLDILKKRYANGEITKKEFDEMKKDLL